LICIKGYDRSPSNRVTVRSELIPASKQPTSDVQL